MTLEEVKANCKEGWKVNQKIAEAIIKRINICDGECPCHNESDSSLHMVLLVQLVERKFVALVVTGSSPV